MPLGPAQVHAQEHLGEVGRVVAARARADRHDRGAIVVRAVEESLHLELADHILQVGDLAERLGGGVVVVHLLRELDEHVEVVEALLDVGDPLEVGLAVAERARHLLGLLDVVPEVGRTRLFGQALDLRAQRGHIDHRRDVGERGAQGLDVGGGIEFKHDSPD